MWDIITGIGPGNFLAFVGGGLLVNLTPGQDIFFASASGIQGGPRCGVMAGLGVGAGALWHVALSALGLSALIAANPEALAAIKYAGAAYLLYIAWQSWSAPRDISAGIAQRSGWAAFRKGALTNMLNPKPILFMLAFLPQFVDPALGPVWMQIVFLGTVFGITGTLITAGFGYLAGRAGHAIGVRLGLLNKVAAVLFAGLAARLLTE
ncbi:MAG: Lysine exporter protein LysE/YggA [Rhodobacteraceae bacterium]|uniref:LysE family translocator n=1 Tax=Cypionkella sp. TaxID=2811411 RepID=UPI00132A6595|nr:LysE family translocator [Cypionkella sp.]KAF0174564.1 MAG: Lysine exporter protein LysE/YggA [Paracoccaceae bacterium]MDO8328423.1 LysE family translocator [Cypionkella sp.]